MPHPNTFSHNTLIDFFVASGDPLRAVSAFNATPNKDNFSYNTIVSGLMRAGHADFARRIFDAMPHKDITAWTRVIHGCIRCGRPEEGLELFRRMNAEIHARVVVADVGFDPVLCSSLVNMYGKCGDLDCAERVLGLMREKDEFVLSALIVGYAGCGRLDDARRVFDGAEATPSIVLWNSMISGYVANNQLRPALEFFKRMRLNGVSADSATLSSVLGVCGIMNCKQTHAYACKVGTVKDVVVVSALIDGYAKCGCADEACRIFGEVEVRDTVLLNSMINVYSNCGRIEDARRIFEMMPQKSLISWNSMVVGFSQNGCATEAWHLFLEMHRLGIQTDVVSLASIISSCASVCYIALGEQVFARAIVLGLDSNHIISSSLVDLYCKCGDILSGLKLFDSIRKIDVVLWNSMLMGYSMHGYGVECLNLFADMRAANVRPNDVTFIAILSSCNHCGLVEEGRRWFYAMKEYDVHPIAEHWSCFIDMLVRSGRVDEAVNVIETMMVASDANMCSSVLRGCMAFGEGPLGEKSAQRLIEIDSENPNHYVRLSNVYASSGAWERSAQVRRIMSGRRIAKNPGLSWID
ncbi:putative pentatricopeptide repeat-containing protein [Acorus calamus]|uniref:Pentatricopeptide repeat-containing protein n=1 Tax=Acorus calamus TaxID=4465 RepID=A0AAV9DI21_ACOCL|nr:putative pentatricopeptide repeat-containing protein [Acorus calamus]